MRFADKNRGSRAFTLVEVLAALVFMAILIPVTMEAVQVANRAGQVGERKAATTRIAERLLNELVVTGQPHQSAGRGTIEERDRVYEWTLRSEPWREDQMTLVTITVTYKVQGKEYEVKLATIYDPTVTTTAQLR